MDKDTLFVRTPKNELDKSTIVSIFPKPITEHKVTVFPGEYRIPAGTYEKPGLLVIGSGVWNREIHESNQILEIPIPSIQLAASIVKDYCSAVLGFSQGAKPGLFYVFGEVTVEQVKKSHAKELESAKQAQHNWFLNLVRMADIDWARTGGNPLGVSDSARMAAEILRLDKPWMQDFKQLAMGQCPACGTQRATQFPVCANCKTIIDKEAYAKLQLVSA